MIRVWRLCKARWKDTAFDGEGARRAGGRWNSRGNAVVYTAESLSLAALELLVHLDVQDAPPDMVAIPAAIPDALDITRVTPDELPDQWRRATGHPELKSVGDDWVERGDTAVLRAPSVVIPAESNYVLNPEHPDFEAIDVGEAREFSFDRRLLDQ